MVSSIDKLAKELKKQMTASDERKPKPYDTQAEVLRVENGVAWVHIPGGVDETPARLTINAKKGDNVNLHVANGTAWITGNSTNPPTDDSTANYAVNISNEVKKDVTVLNTVVAENIEATNARFINVEADTAKIHTLTAEKILATVGYIEDLTADSITANDISAASGYIKDLEADNITAQDISASSGYIKDLEADNITAQDISASSGYIKDLTAGNVAAQDVIADHATVGNLDTTYAKINAANINTATIRNAWVDKIMVQTGLLAYSSQIYTLDAIEVNAANITAGTLDVNRLIVTVGEGSSAQKYLVKIDPSTGTPSYEKLDGNIVEPRTITANKIVANSITTDEITVNNLVGTSGWINLHDGKFFYGNGADFATSANAISWNGSKLQIKADEFLLSTGKTIQDSIESVENWFYSVPPTTSNAPANSWTTTNLKEQHLRDIYFDTTSGKSYRWAKEGSTYKWVEIEDVELAALAKDLHDNYPPRSEFTVAPNQIQSTVSAAQTAATNAANTATDNKLKNYSTTTQMNSAITQKANEITQSVSQTYQTKDAMSGYYTKSQTDSAITQKAGEISLSVAQTEIGKIEVGGRNLLLDSNNGSKYFWTQNGGAFSKAVDESGATFTITQLPASGSWGVIIIRQPSLREKIVAGETYTLSFDIKVNVAISNVSFGFNIREGNGANPFLKDHQATVPITASTWTHIVNTTTALDTLPSSSNSDLYITAQKFTEQLCSFSIRNVKVEKGNKATDWTPAPEDIDGRVDTLEIFKSEFTVTPSAISSEVQATQNGETLVSRINQTADTVKIQAKHVEIDGTATFNAIKSKADAAYDAKGVASAVQTNLDNLKVGGRNLIWDSEWKDVSHRWHEWGTKNTREIVAINGERFLHLVTTGTSFQGYEQAEYYRSGKDDIQAGDKIVVSFTAYAKTAGQKATIGIHWRNSSGSIISQTWIPDGGVSLTTSAKRYSTLVWTVPDGAVAFNIMIGQSIASAQELWISRPMMEKATKASDWSPAPEDVQGEINAKKSVHTLMSASAGNTYANILTWTAEGYSNGWWIDVAKTPLTGIKVGDTCRVAYKVTDMDNAYVYVVGEMTSISGSTLTMTMHGLDTTIIDGGNILTNSITANQIASNAITADKIAANAITIGDMDSSTASKVNNGDSALTKVNYYNRACQVGNSSATQTAYWRKFASYTETGIWRDDYIIFDVSNNGDFGVNKRFGKLKAHIRTEGTAGVVSTPNVKLEWITRSEGISLGHFVLAYKATSGTDVKVELWAYCPDNYTGYRFGMVEEGQRGVIRTTPLWTLYDDWTPNGQANITSGYTQVVSTDIDAARTTATTYITHIDNNGIRIHPSSTENNSVLINESGVTLYKGGTTDAYRIAQYGDTARIGKPAGKHININDSGMTVFMGDESTASNNVASFGATARVGKEASRHIEISDSGFEVRKNKAVSLATIGYGTGAAESGSGPGPYYIFGSYLDVAEAPANYSISGGVYSEALGYCSRAIGYYVNTNYAYQTAIGKYNSNNSNNVFEIGWGTSDTPKNIFEVTNAGVVKANGVSISSTTRNSFTPTSGASYSGYGGCYYEKYGNVVHVHVGVSGLTANTATNIATLPAGYRPHSMVCAHGTGGTWDNLGYLQISDAGVVMVRSKGTYCGADVTYIV